VRDLWEVLVPVLLLDPSVVMPLQVSVVVPLPLAVMLLH
jgi:hypothetical protein